MGKLSTDAITLADEEGDVALPPPVVIGSVVGGKYVIKRVLGAGGNGAVYEGEHTAVGHRVAIKVVHPTLASRTDIIARFQREARICGTLRHPHVGQVYDVGTLDDGAPYMVMELQEGRSFADVIDETRIPIAAILHVVRQLLDGLSAAHEAGAVHRDVKPDNVMIVRDRSGEVVVKLVDFGISKSLGDSRDHSVTGEGLIVGSPDYMSPEQLRGVDVDVRTDIYSTGVLLYEAITGRRPFVQEKLVDLMTSIMRDPVTRPTQLRGDCPQQLETVVLKAMSRDAAQRYASAGEMSRALEAVQALSRGAPAVNLVHLSERPQRRQAEASAENAIPYRSWRLWLVALVAVASASAVGAWALRASPPDSTPARIATPAQLERAPERATTAAAPAPSTEPSPSVQPAPAIEPVVIALPAAESAASEQVSDVEATRKPARASRAGQRLAESVPAAPSIDTNTLNALMKQAATAFALGESGRARDLYRQVVGASPARADAWRGLGLASNRLGERAEATRAFERYLTLRPDAPDAARIREQLERAP